MIKKKLIKLKVISLRINRRLWWESILLVMCLVIVDYLISLKGFTDFLNYHFESISNRNLSWIQYDLSRVFQVSSVVSATIATIASLVFSITIVALMSIASNFSIRYIINVFNHKTVRLVLTIFIFTYCYTLFFPVINGNAGSTLPAKTSFMFILVLLCVGHLLIYIKYLIKSIQIDSICEYNCQIIVNELKNETMLVEERECIGSVKQKVYQGTTHPIASQQAGFVNDIAYQKLYDIACEEHFCLEVLVRKGDFLLKASPLLSIKSSSHVSKDIKTTLQNCIKITRVESQSGTIQKHLTQLVDIAIKSLSPGMNDTNSAIIVINYLAAIMQTLFELGTPSNFFLNERGYKTLIIKIISVERILYETLDTIRFYASNNQPALCYLVKTLGYLLVTVENKKQQALIKEQVDAIEETIKTHNFQKLDADNLMKEIIDFNKMFKRKGKSGD